MSTYKVVKFMVKVKFMESTPNKPFGKVRVRKVTAAYRTPGMERKKKLKLQVRRPAIVASREKGKVDERPVVYAVEVETAAGCVIKAVLTRDGDKEAAASCKRALS